MTANTAYSSVQSADELQVGDHISWPTRTLSGKVQHHAFVVALEGENSFRVIHHSPGLFESSSGAANVEEIVNLKKKIRKRKLRRYNDDLEYCGESVEASKARSILFLVFYTKF